MKQEFPKGVEVAQVQGTPLSNRRRTRKRNGTTASKVRHIATCHESLSRIGHVHPQASEGVLGALRANAKIRSGNSTRFTPNEVNDLRKVGLDLADVKCQNDIDPVVTWWAHTLAYERFDLLEQIAVEMAKAKGVKLPPKLSVAK